MTPPAALRWLLVLPAAILALYVAHIVIGMAAWLVLGSGSNSTPSTVIYYVQLLFYYAPKEAAFVIAGASVAPRGKGATAIVLAALAALMSLMVHLLGPHSVGVVNYTHFIAESAGTIFGVACVFYALTRQTKSIRNGQTSHQPSSEDSRIDRRQAGYFNSRSD